MPKLYEITEVLGARVYNANARDEEIIGGYAGDLLSEVMAKAERSCAWFTVMTNVNVSAVAVAAEIGAIVLCGGNEPTDVLLSKAKEHGINLIGTDKSVYDAVKTYSATFG